MRYSKSVSKSKWIRGVWSHDVIRLRRYIALFAGAGAFFFLSSCSNSNTPGDASQSAETRLGAGGDVRHGWNAAAAAAYLDQREIWWMSWSGAARDHETFCISCHTSVPYILARPVLRAALNENGLSATEKAVFNNTSKRVRLWNEVEPYYNDSKYHSADSRATEAVLNALVLAARDSGTGTFEPDTQMAFQNMWSLQIASGQEAGAWSWQQFGLDPWENADSIYFGATMGALAIAIAPENYRGRPEIKGNLDPLREYLRSGSDAQPLLNKVFLLWVSTKLPVLLTADQQRRVINELFDKQQADGGWNLYSLTRSLHNLHFSSLLDLDRRADGSKQETRSDGFATGLIVFVLEQTGIERTNNHFERALTWLIANQDKKEGMWVAYSLNKRRDPSSNVGRFMSDAATAFAVLALSQTKQPVPSNTARIWADPVIGIRKHVD
jgi:squalene-hopene/tetraprenyl-beta-curcumene cyclase